MYFLPVNVTVILPVFFNLWRVHARSWYFAWLCWLRSCLAVCCDIQNVVLVLAYTWSMPDVVLLCTETHGVLSRILNIRDFGYFLIFKMGKIMLRSFKQQKHIWACSNARVHLLLPNNTMIICQSVTLIFSPAKRLPLRHTVDFSWQLRYGIRTYIFRIEAKNITWPCNHRHMS